MAQLTPLRKKSTTLPNQKAPPSVQRAQTGPSSGGAVARRDTFRRYTTDGALLYFHPNTGTTVRIANERTLHLRRQAPRVAMFGFTNACNLSCSFCSRDVSVRSAWSVDSAAQLLEGLDAAGTLEVAFGGGEPFASASFPDLVARLFETTRLALNVTTNGTLLTKERLALFGCRLQQVRMSLYDGTDWQAAAHQLSEAGQLWGANLLLDDRALNTLPERLNRLAALGCHDVSLLSYVGSERTLTPNGQRRLASIVRESPLPCRVSVCMGTRTLLPQLFYGLDTAPDCGAGRDFVTITPDQRLQSCSFQEESHPGATAEEVLTAWNEARTELAREAKRSGCARAEARVETPNHFAPVAVWQGYSGNNSGECIMVARFAEVADAESYLAELLPNWSPEADVLPPGWRELFETERVVAPDFDNWSERDPPAELVGLSATVVASGYGLDELFPELRALAWKRGAWVRPGGVHLHNSATFLGALRAENAQALDELAQTAQDLGLETFPHGETLFMKQLLDGRDGTPSNLEKLAPAWLDLSGGKRAATDVLLEEVSAATLLRAKKRLGHLAPSQPRLWLSFWTPNGKGAKKAQRFFRSLDNPNALCIDHYVLFAPAAAFKRTSVLAHRAGAAVSLLESPEVRITVDFFHKPLPKSRAYRAPLSTEEGKRLTGLLERRLAGTSSRTLTTNNNKHAPALRLALNTDEPRWALEQLELARQELHCELAIYLSDTDSVARSLARLLTLM